MLTAASVYTHSHTHKQSVHSACEFVRKDDHGGTVPSISWFIDNYVHCTIIGIRMHILEITACTSISTFWFIFRTLEYQYPNWNFKVVKMSPNEILSQFYGSFQVNRKLLAHFK